MLARRFARLERDIRCQEQYRGIPRVVAAKRGELSYAPPRELSLNPHTGDLKMPYPTGGRGFMDAHIEYTSQN